MQSHSRVILRVMNSIHYRRTCRLQPLAGTKNHRTKRVSSSCLYLGVFPWYLVVKRPVCDQLELLLVVKRQAHYISPIQYIIKDTLRGVTRGYNSMVTGCPASFLRFACVLSAFQNQVLLAHHVYQ